MVQDGQTLRLHLASLSSPSDASRYPNGGPSRDDRRPNGDDRHPNVGDRPPNREDRRSANHDDHRFRKMATTQIAEFHSCCSAQLFVCLVSLVR